MTMRIRTAALLVLPFALAACTTAAPIAGPQTSAGHTRTYPGVSPAQVYAAAERLFVLADAPDVQITHGPAGDLRATRSWYVYALLAVFPSRADWTIFATPEGEVTI